MKKFITSIIVALVAIVSVNAQSIKVESVYATSAHVIGVADIDALPKADFNINRFEFSDTHFSFQLTTEGTQYIMYLQLEKADYMPTHRCTYHYSVTSGSLITASSTSSPSVNVFDFHSGQVTVSDGQIVVRGTVLVEDPSGNGYNTTCVEFVFE